MVSRNQGIAERVCQLIEYKTVGNRVLFAQKVGWSKQRLTNILAGKSIGLTVVADILEAYPDVNARWLVFGRGNMLTIAEPHFGARFESIIAFEKYLPAMTGAEAEALGRGKNDWSDTDISRWQSIIDERTKKLADRFAAACGRRGMKSSKDSCATPEIPENTRQ